MATDYITHLPLDPPAGVTILTGEPDPTIGSGVNAVLGSWYIRRTTGDWYKKTGTASTAWTIVVAGAGLTQSQADARYLQLTGGTVSGDVDVDGSLSENGILVALAGDSYTKATADARFAPKGLTSITTFDGGSDVNVGRQVDRPASNYTRIVTAELKNRANLNIPGTGTYASVLTISTWSDASAGAVIGQLAWVGDLVSWRSATIGGAWSAWKSLAKVGDSYSTTTADGRFLQISTASATYLPKAGGALTGLLTMAGATVAQLFPNNARIASKNSTGTQAGEFILVAGDNQTYITLAAGGGFKVRSSTNTVLLNVDESGHLTATADVTAFSDRRYKSRIKTLRGSLSRILQLRGVEYVDRRTKRRQLGVIADEVQDVQPLLVHEHDLGDGSAPVKTMSYGRLTAELLEAIKEVWTLVCNRFAQQTKTVAKLEQRLAKAEATIVKLKAQHIEQRKLLRAMENLEHRLQRLEGVAE